MSNPDGVVLGQHRTLLSGLDMSLSWSTDSSEGEVQCIKQRLIDAKQNLFAFCEIGSHTSSTKGTFVVTSVADKHATNLDWTTAAMFAKICGDATAMIDVDNSFVMVDDGEE